MRTIYSNSYRLEFDLFLDGIKCMPASCFTFRLPAELQAEDVTMAELWLYKEQDMVDSENQTLIISEGGPWESNHSNQMNKQLVVHRTDVKGMDLSYIFVFG